MFARNTQFRLDIRNILMAIKKFTDSVAHKDTTNCKPDRPANEDIT